MAPDESRYMEPLQLAGRLIMENGGETYRVEETILRMGHAFGLANVDSFAVPSGIFLSYRKSDGSMETSVTRVHAGNTNLSCVDGVNAVSRQLEKGEIGYEEATERLRSLSRSTSRSRKAMLMLGAILSAGGFAVMFGGEWWSCIFAVITGIVVEAVTIFLDKHKAHSMVITLVGSFVNAFLPMVFNGITGLGVVEAMVAGAMMTLLPGLAMTNAVQDTMRGDMVSGLSHGISALLTAALIACGTLAASFAFNMMMGGIG